MGMVYDRLMDDYGKDKNNIWVFKYEARELVVLGR